VNPNIISVKVVRDRAKCESGNRFCRVTCDWKIDCTLVDRDSSILASVR
jgi:acetone carboxylase gamma subunit